MIFLTLLFCSSQSYPVVSPSFGWSGRVCKLAAGTCVSALLVYRVAFICIILKNLDSEQN